MTLLAWLEQELAKAEMQMLAAKQEAQDLPTAEYWFNIGRCRAFGAVIAKIKESI